MCVVITNVLLFTIKKIQKSPGCRVASEIFFHNN